MVFEDSTSITKPSVSGTPRFLFHIQMPGYVPYKGIFDAIVRIISEEGIKTMYSGLLPSLFLTSHAAIQFVIYEKIKQMDKKHDISGVRFFSCFLCRITRLGSTAEPFPSSVHRW